METPAAAVKKSVGWYTPNKTWQEHFWIYTAKSEEPDGCWVWSGAVRKRDGYSQMEVLTGEGVRCLRTAHQASWLIHKGVALEKGLVLRHTCDNRLCVNPAHLVPGTQKDNMRDMIERGRAHAKLNVEKVREIRRRASEGQTFATLARDFDVSRSQIGRICKGERWAHVVAVATT
jgi:hypothetical protein